LIQNITARYIHRFNQNSEKDHQQELLGERINVGKTFANAIYDWQRCHKPKVI
jgi:hypothetical protein